MKDYVIGVVIFAAILLMFAMMSRGRFGQGEKFATGQDFQRYVDGATQDITTSGGTKAQQIVYPTYTDLVQYGVTSVPIWKDPNVEIDFPIYVRNG